MKNSASACVLVCVPEREIPNKCWNKIKNFVQKITEKVAISQSNNKSIIAIFSVFVQALPP
jgi:hypothetical protein